jgi:hypothetical protein
LQAGRKMRGWLIHPSAWKVDPRKSITAILNKPRFMGQLERISQSQFANRRVEVGQKKCMDNDQKHTPSQKIHH